MMLESIISILFIYIVTTWIVVSCILRIRHIGSYNQHAIDDLTYAIKVLREKIEALENAHMSVSHQPIRNPPELNKPTETDENNCEFVNDFHSESGIQQKIENSNQGLISGNATLSDSEPDISRQPPLLPKSSLASERNTHPEISHKSSISTSSLWKKIEKQIADNWTGIIGTMVLVLGVGFLGIYTALKMNELFRFLLVIGCSLVMNGVFIIYRHTEKWKKLALWMRSASGAVFLFACLGAGGIPGLHWIDNPLLGLLILLLGIAVNLFLAVIGGKQIFASLHVLFALTALAIAPQSQTTLIIATVVVLFAVSLTFKDRWDFHLLLSISLFFIYHLFWYLKIGGKDSLTSNQNVLALILVSSVFILAAIVHYRKLYNGRDFDKIPFFVHLTNWLCFGSSIVIHINSSKWNTFPLFAGAIAAFFLANYARKLKIRWLHCSDTLIAQIFSIITITSLGPWGIGYDIILLIIFLQLIAFTRLIIFAREEILFRAGIVLTQMAGFALIITLGNTLDIDDNIRCLKTSIVTVISAVGIFALHWYFACKKDNSFLIKDSFLSLTFLDTKPREFSFSGFLTSIFLVISAISAHQMPWLYYGVMAVVIILLILRNKLRTNGLNAGVMLLIMVLFGFTWNNYYIHILTQSEILISGLPLFLIALCAIYWDTVSSKNNHAKWFGIYLGILHFIVFTHIAFKTVSPLIPGVCWILGSLVVLEISRFISYRYKNGTIAIGEPDRYLLQTGYLLIVAFIIRHVLIDLQVENYLGTIKVRLLIEALALAVMFYWALSKKTKNFDRFKSWIFLHPLFTELIMLFGIMIICVEIDKYWHPLIWITGAFMALFIGKMNNSLSRLKAYSLLLYWASIIQVAFLLSIYTRIGIYWYQKDWFLGTLSIVMQFSFLVMFYNSSSLSQIYFSQALVALNRIVKWIRGNQNIVLFYPLLFCISVFLYFTFSNSVLTLLFVLECFVVFIISIVLREQHFRFVSLIGIIICITRLFVFDLARSTTLVKAFVFLGVGIIMLGMNILYNKFKVRLFMEKSNETS